MTRAFRAAAAAFALAAPVACGDDDPVVPDPPRAASVEVVSGDGQAGFTGGALAEPVVVRVLGRDGNPFSGATVRFEPGDGHGSATPDSVVSAADGSASTSWTLGDAVGAQVLGATVPGGPRATLSATGLAPAGVMLAPSGASVPEGGVATLDIVVAPAPAAPIVVRYTLGADDNPETADADGDDYEHASSSVEIAAGDTGATIEIVTRDDDAIEPPREVFLLALDTPMAGSGYELGASASAAVTIEEGVCDRTPQVRDEIVRQAETDGCTGVGNEHLALILDLDLSMVVGRRQTGLAAAFSPCGGAVRDFAEIMGDFGSTRPAEAGRNPCEFGPEGKATGSRGPGHVQGAGEAIVALRDGDFAYLPGLETLSLAGNRLAELRAGVFSGLSTVRSLDLTHNELAELPGDVFSGLPNLELLSLFANRLATLPQGIFSGLSGLDSLAIGGNPLTELPDGVFSGLSDLDVLELTGTSLSRLPVAAFSDLSSLAELYLVGNRFSTLADRVFSGLSDLEVLRLDANHLATLPADVFSGLSGLSLLVLAQNPLGELPEGVFSELAQLDTLVLGLSPLTELPEGVFSGLSDLDFLYVVGTDLAALPANAFAGLSALEVLNLAGNQLATLPVGMLSDLSRLQVLNLAGNRLTALPAGMFAGLRPLKQLWLHGNPGAPFSLALEVERTDGDPLAPGPATLAVTIAEGAPFDMAVDLTSHGGSLSAGRVMLAAGSVRSTPFTATREAENQAAVYVSAGAPPPIPRGGAIRGIEIGTGDPIVLFVESSNRPPVIIRPIPPYVLGSGGRAAELTGTRYFRDPDGDVLVYTASSRDPAIAATVDDGRVTLAPRAEGTATFTLTATDPAGLAVRQTVPVTVTGTTGPESFDIQIALVDPGTESQNAALQRAAERWMAVLADTELPNVPIAEGGSVHCPESLLGPPPYRVAEVDDLMVLASIVEIDGPRGVLAAAGPCGIREGSLPYMGVLTMDAADLERLAESGNLDELALHEMGHVLGIGALWEVSGLLRNPSVPDSAGADTHFAGVLAVDAFDAAGGADYEGGKVPVENQAGGGSGDAHWRESVLDTELMTPFHNTGVANPFSAITIQSLADLGYTVDTDHAEPFQLPGTTAALRARPGRVIDLSGDVYRGPVVVVDENGRVVRLIRNQPRPRR